MCSNSDTALCDLDPDYLIQINRSNSPPLLTTPRELINQARLPAFLTLDQVEFIFSE